MQRTIRRDAATLGLEGAPAYPPPSRESTTISSTFSREATIPRSSTFLREATGWLISTDRATLHYATPTSLTIEDPCLT